MNRLTIYVAILTIVSSCSMYEVSNLNSNIKKETLSKIEVLNSTEKCDDCIFVADFNIKDDNSKNIEIIKNKTLDLMNSNYANIIQIYDFRQGGRRIKGRFYQKNKVLKLDKTRKIFFFRDEIGAYISSTFRTKLTYNGIEVIVPDRSFAYYEIPYNITQFKIQINNKDAILDLTDGNNYFLLSKNNQSFPSSNQISISFGGQSCVKIEDKLIAKMWVSVLKEI